MPDFLFELPLAVTGPAIIGGLCLFAIGGLLFVRRWILPHLRIHIDDSQFSGSMVQCVMVFYGLAVALIAVNVSQTYLRCFKSCFQRGQRVERALPRREQLSRTDPSGLAAGASRLHGSSYPW